MQRYENRTILIVGTLGYVTWTNDGNRLSYNIYGNNSNVEVADPAFSFETMFENQAKAFLENLSPSLNDDHLRNAWVSQAIVTAAKESMSDRRMVTLPPLFQSF